MAVFFERFRAGNMLAAVVVVGIVLLLIVPVPAEVLDVLLSINIVVGLLVIVMSMAIQNPLEFSIFPTLLLVATLARLSLDVSATRMILLYGHILNDDGIPVGAGAVIPAFGRMVLGGNILVGIILFLILEVIQFLVITSGAERISQVAARFTLDAMPFRHMPIDQELSAGIIDAATARKRREAVDQESDFYGAMDGAGRFVRGDAMAAVVIMIINLVGGLIMGVLFHDLSAAEAFRTYALLSIGNALVTTVPAFLMSTSMAMIVTRAASHGDLTESITGTFTAQPATLQTVAAIATLLGGLGVVGWFALPPLPFFCMGAILGGAASHIEKRNLTAQQTQVTAQTQQVHEKVRQPANAMSVLPVDALALEVGRGLLSLVDEAQGAKLLERVTAIRRHVAQELGFIVPGVRFRDNLQLKPNGYSIRVREIEVAQGEVMVAQFLAIAPEEKLRSLRGVKTVDPTYGMPAVWINAEQRGEAERLGCMIFDPVSVVATHLTEVVRSHAADLLGGQEAQALLDTVKRTHPAILRELMPDVLPLVDVRKILQNLLRERVSIRDLVIIVETLADHARSTRDCEALTECVRVALARTICREYVNAEGVINALTLDPGLETALAAPFLDPSVGHAFLSALGLEVSHLQERGLQPIILCAPALRPTVRKLTDLTFPSLVILSWSEMAPRVRVNPLGMVSV